MTPEIKADIEKLIRDEIGRAEDNLFRAECAARKHDPRKQWGESGQTLQQIIDGYQAQNDRYLRALAAFAEIESK
jgi:hypothetical protein